MILVKTSKLLPSDIRTSSAKKMWKGGCFLKKPNNCFAPIKKIFIYSQAQGDILFHVSEFKGLPEAILDFESNAEAFIFDVKPNPTLKLKRKISFKEGDVFYIGSDTCDLYLPDSLVEILCHKEYFETTPTLKRRIMSFDFSLKKYPDNVFVGTKVLAVEDLQVNHAFISDFFKTFNYNNSPTWKMTPKDMFPTLSNELKNNLIHRMKDFIDKYETVKLEGCND